ncbi:MULTISPECIES: hypothetical protein [Methylococcus]|uniref:Uncharacterized protein n=1 Tax=Methylococcus capsulatus TaxID=414 RepID=A0ABZ2F7L9_METCP|nr:MULTISPECIES: hypothetical protein [Methylococcus]MDF9390932.1 hypothetical protein [Methylococcus capsulatus]
MVGALDPQWFAQSTDGELSRAAAQDESPDEAEIGPIPNLLIDIALIKLEKMVAPGFHWVLRHLTRRAAGPAGIPASFGIARPTAPDVDPAAENRHHVTASPNPEVFP